MNKEQLEKRKKLIAELILENEFYVPMKTKEIAILLQIPKSPKRRTSGGIRQLSQ